MKRSTNPILAACVAIIISALQTDGASIEVTVNGNSGPWMWTSNGLNSAFQYGVNDQQAPTVVSAADGLDFTPGNELAIQYVGGLVYQGGGWPLNDAGGSLWYGPVWYGPNGDTNADSPCFYFAQTDNPVYAAELVGTFADDSGAVVGTPFKVGNFRYVTIPAGATRLQLGDDDGYYGDNSGSWQIRVSEFPEDTLQPSILYFQPTNQVLAFGGSASVFVGAIGASPLTYQWFSNGVAVASATNQSFTATNLGYGMFSCNVVVSNTYGAVTSSVATAGVSIPWNGIVWNGDFETPQIGNWISGFSPDAVWTGQQCGILSTAYPYGAGYWEAPPGPVGPQMAFLENAGAYMSQTITLPLDGIYHITYQDAARGIAGSGDTTYQILLDTNLIAQVQTASHQTFTPESFEFGATRGEHTLIFEVITNLDADDAAFFDGISIDGPEPLHFNSPEPTENGFLLHLTGLTGHGSVVIFASSDLASWTPIYTNAPLLAPIVFLDSAPTNYPARFYRAVEQ